MEIKNMFINSIAFYDDNGNCYEVEYYTRDLADFLDADEKAIYELYNYDFLDTRAIEQDDNFKDYLFQKNQGELVEQGYYIQEDSI